jgi:hypothetical protein
MSDRIRIKAASLKAGRFLMVEAEGEHGVRAAYVILGQVLGSRIEEGPLGPEAVITLQRASKPASRRRRST